MDNVNKKDNIVSLDLPAPLLFDIHNALTFALLNQSKFQKEGNISIDEIMVIQRLRDGIGDILDKVEPGHPVIGDGTSLIH